MNTVAVVGAVRTPLGAFGGSLSGFTAAELGAVAILELLKRARLAPRQLDEIIMGNMLQSRADQALARRTVLKAGLPGDIPAAIVNKMHASGMEAVRIAAGRIQSGKSTVIIAGGMESVSNSPRHPPENHPGDKPRRFPDKDIILRNGRWDTYNDAHMIRAAERSAQEHKISRKEQDAFALTSCLRALKAQGNGYFDKELIRMKVRSRKGDITEITEDEVPKRIDPGEIPRLKPLAAEDGSVTAANAASTADGAAALLLMSGDKADELGLRPMARIAGCSIVDHASGHPEVAPANAILHALDHAGVEIRDIDLFEIHEAYSAICVLNRRQLNLDPEKVDIQGGAISLGHPPGCSGTRILVTLIHALHRTGGSLGCAGICSGDGGASAMVLEASGKE